MNRIAWGRSMAGTPMPGRPARGSASGRPVMVPLAALGRKWSLRVLWELRAGPSSFRALRTRCDDASPTVLNARLKELRDLGLVVAGPDGYDLSEDGRSLGDKLVALDAWAEDWAEDWAARV